MAFVNLSPLASPTSTVITPVYANAIAGNLLVAFVNSNMATPAPYTLSGAIAGWTQRLTISSVNIQCELWDKIATGSDVMPTWNQTLSGAFTCQIAEFNVTTVFDQGGTFAGSTSPNTVTATGIDGGPGRLIVMGSRLRTAAAGLNTFTFNVNSLGVGSGINLLGDDSGLSLFAHHESLYVTTATTGVSPDNCVQTATTATNHTALCIASYAVAQGGSHRGNAGARSVATARSAATTRTSAGARSSS